MAVNVFIWGSVNLPLAVLLWLHRLYMAVLSPFVRDRSLEEQWEALQSAETFEEWKAAGLELDRWYRIDAWRKDDRSRLYAWELIRDRLAAFDLALDVGHVQAIVHLLQSGLVRNLGNMTAPALYNRSFAGTKYLIESYVLRVCEIVGNLAALPGVGGTSAAASLSPQLARAVREGRCGPLLSGAQKRQLFRNLRQSFGRTTLVLQGGSVFGLCHLGVARALFLRGLLPRIITGTGTGALMAALLGTHTDAELPAVLNGEPMWAAVSQGSRSQTLWDRLLHFWRAGSMLDARVLERCVRDNGGEMTFAEAFARTGRVLNITAATGSADVPAVLNHVTTPNVLIWTAAAASNADHVWNGDRQTPILCRNSHGQVVPWPLAHAVRRRKWPSANALDRSEHPPLQRLAQLFNVNHFVVSQARPYLVPLLQPSLHSPTMQGWAFTTLSYMHGFARQQLRHFVHHRLEQMARLCWLPRALCRLLLDERVPGKDSLVLVPQVAFSDYLRLLDTPTPDALCYWVAKGERAVWPAVAALKIRCSVELALEEACAGVGV